MVSINKHYHALKEYRVFDEKVNEIDRKYCELGLDLGWRFLTCRKSNLNPSTDTIVIVKYHIASPHTDDVLAAPKR